MDMNQRINRLLHFREVLEWVKSRQNGTVSLRMSTWGRLSLDPGARKPWRRRPKAEDPDEAIVPAVANDESLKRVVGCGFAACALGWAALDPEFRRAGLLFVVDTDSNFVIEAEVEYRGLTADEAGAAFFGLTSDEAALLFVPSFHADIHLRQVTIDDVLTHLDWLIDKFRDGLRPPWEEIKGHARRHYGSRQVA